MMLALVVHSWAYADTVTRVHAGRSNDSDYDGIPDDIEGSVDSDGDHIPDFEDTDSDDDTIPDSTEHMDDPVWDDYDGDGILNYLDTDSDNDGKPDSNEVAFCSNPYDATSVPPPPSSPPPDARFLSGLLVAVTAVSVVPAASIFAVTRLRSLSSRFLGGC